MSEDFLNFDKDKFDEDFGFSLQDPSSTIPENDLLDYINPTSITSNSHSNRDHVNPAQILENSYKNSYQNSFPNNSFNRKNSGFNDEAFSPVASPYTDPTQLSVSYNINSSSSNAYDNIASPQPNNGADLLNSQYLSPSTKSFTSTRQHSITSPNSYGDAFSPYGSSFDTLKSPSLRSGSSLPKQQLSKEDKLRRRREFHNQVERRRRDLIKERIKELGLIVPPSLLLVDGEGRDVKPSKSVIINKTVEYVQHLTKVMKYQETKKLELTKKIEELEKLPDVNSITKSTNSLNLSSNDSYPSSNVNSTPSAEPNFQDFDLSEFLEENKQVQGDV